MCVTKDKYAHLRAPGCVPHPCSPVSVEDSFHLGDVGLERDGTEFVQLLVVEQQVLVPETNGSQGVKDRNWDCQVSTGLVPCSFLVEGENLRIPRYPPPTPCTPQLAPGEVGIGSQAMESPWPQPPRPHHHIH